MSKNIETKKTERVLTKSERWFLKLYNILRKNSPSTIYIDARFMWMKEDPVLNGQLKLGYSF